MTMQWKPTGWTLVAAAAAIAVAVPQAMAQRDPAYEAARSAGQIGEQPDGYLGFVSTPTPAVREMVNDINIKRKAAYTSSRARGQHDCAVRLHHRLQPDCQDQARREVQGARRALVDARWRSARARSQLPLILPELQSGPWTANAAAPLNAAAFTCV